MEYYNNRMAMVPLSNEGWDYLVGGYGRTALLIILSLFDKLYQFLIHWARYTQLLSILLGYIDTDRYIFTFRICSICIFIILP